LVKNCPLSTLSIASCKLMVLKTKVKYFCPKYIMLWILDCVYYQNILEIMVLSCKVGVITSTVWRSTSSHGKLLWNKCVTDDHGNVLFVTDDHGNVLFVKDDHGNVLFVTDDHGNVLFVTDDHGNVLFVTVTTPFCFSRSWSYQLMLPIIIFLTWLTQRVPLVEQEMPVFLW
jgi:hypothetical protein